MELTLVRSYNSFKCTVGKLTVGNFSCYTLEDVVRPAKIYGQTAIPTGRYKVIVDYSNRFKKKMLHILDVPGFDGIRIHAGNTDADTEGCILVGYNWYGKGDAIQNSRVALYALTMLINSALNAHEEVWITIK